MILWHTFLPNEVNVNVKVEQFRSLVIPKMKLLLQDAIFSNNLLVKSREKLIDLSSKDNQNKSLLQEKTRPSVCSDIHKNVNELLPAHGQRIKTHREKLIDLSREDN